MNVDTGPTLDQWQDLRTIVYHVEAIVADPPEKHDAYVGKGLLDWPPGSRDLDSAKMRERHSARHAKQLTGFLLSSSNARVLEIIPGIDRLGESRIERTEGLIRRLIELPAYRWLHNHLAYQDCLKTLDFLGKTKPAYATATREFMLLHAITFPIQLLQLQRERNITPQYPTRSELETGYRQVRDFSRFLSERSAITAVLDMPYSMQEDLKKTVLKFELIMAKYRKPRDDGTLRERSFLDYLIPNLMANFGHCSLALVQGVSAIVDISFDRSDLQARIKTYRTKLSTGGIKRNFGLYSPQAKSD